MNNNNQWKIIRNVIGLFGLLCAPFLSFVLFEYVTGNLSSIPIKMALLNVYWIALLYLLVFAVTSSSRLTLGIASVIVYVISLAETFVVSFRGRPIMLSEVLAINTALSVAGSYSFDISREMVLAGVAVVGMNVLLWFFPVKLSSLRARISNLALCVCGVCLGVYGFYGTIMPKMQLGVNLWSISDSYREGGFILSSAVSLKYMVKEEPEGYSNAELEKIYQEASGLVEARSQQISADAIQPVNLICIMNESLSELKVNGDYETNVPYFPFLDNLSENTIKGSLCVPVYGSLTSNTEYEFLTGDTMALLPHNSIAYQFFVKPGSLSVVSTLKNQGYRAVAMHPYPGENWNRINCYNNMGFDEFWDEEAYQGSEIARHYVTDKADYDKIIELVEAKEDPNEKLFVFNVTMQNHGGYEEIHENFTQDVWLTGELEGKYPKVDQYLSLMKASDEAIEYLMDYFGSCEEPTMIVMFGDHQPGVENEFFEDISGVLNSEMPRDMQLMWYETPFYIWTNYDIQEENMGRLSSIYLASHVLDKANLKITPYDAFLVELSKNVPVIHSLGCYTPDGEFFLWEEVDTGKSIVSEQVIKYENLVYNHSIDTNEMQKLYQIIE
ncbi:MAG: sulfatase-like hydrolase/transferase [Lachnospiraceae bacterium]|nr:sulfatase-like hydrolase/transferase [Lachnospiraceae bacterium]